MMNGRGPEGYGGGGTMAMSSVLWTMECGRGEQGGGPHG